MSIVERLWASGEFPPRDGLYRPDNTDLEIHVDGPGPYHPDAGQPIPFRLGEPFDVRRSIAEDGTVGEVFPRFESPLPDGSGWMAGGGGQMGNIGYLARLNADRTLHWVMGMSYSNPSSVHYQDLTAIFTNDWRNLLILDLADPAFA